MPRLRPNEQQRREKALRRAIARAGADLDLPKDQDKARRLGLSPSAFCKRMKEPYRGFGFDQVSQLARKLEFTGRELCEIVGVAYAPEEGRL